MKNNNNNSMQGDGANKRCVLKCMKMKAKKFNLEGYFQYCKSFFKNELAKKNAEEYQIGFF